MGNESLKKSKISKIQYGIYVESISDEKSTLYNLPLLTEITKLDLDKFINSVNNVIKKHDILNSKIEADESNGNIQISLLDKPLTLDIINITNDKFSKLNLVRPFNLHGGALARFEIYKTEDKVYYFQDIHHIICDGMTLDLISADIENEYYNNKEDNETNTFFDYLNKINVDIPEDKKKEEYDYYDNYISDIDPDNLPLRDTYSDKPSQKWITKKFTLNNDKPKEISNTSFFLSAYAFLLCRFNAIKSIIVNHVYEGRDEDIKNTYGMFIKTLPFAFTFDNNEIIKDKLIKYTSDIKELRNKKYLNFLDLADKYGINNEVNFAYQGDIVN